MKGGKKNLGTKGGNCFPLFWLFVVCRWSPFLGMYHSPSFDASSQSLSVFHNIFVHPSLFIGNVMLASRMVLFTLPFYLYCSPIFIIDSVSSLVCDKHLKNGFLSAHFFPHLFLKCWAFALQSLLKWRGKRSKGKCGVKKRENTSFSFQTTYKPPHAAVRFFFLLIVLFRDWRVRKPIIRYFCYPKLLIGSGDSRSVRSKLFCLK